MKRRDELNAEIENFSSHYKLTPRESEVMGLLCFGTTRIKELAEHLSLSPNTVNNHINSIFAKAKARSKSELLSFFLEFLVKRVDAISAHARAPKVLYLHDGSDASAQVVVKLRNKGIWIEGVAEVKIAIKMLRETPFDFFSYCRSEKVNDWRAMVKAAHEIGIYGPLVLGVGEVSLDLIDALDAGFADLVAGNSADALYEGIRKHYVSAPFRPQKQKLATKAAVELEINGENLGRGGVFVDMALLDGDGDGLDVGDHLELVMAAGERRLKCRGQIVWRRQGTDNRPGLGVRFTHLPQDDVSFLFSLIHDHRIHAYVPAGR